MVQGINNRADVTFNTAALFQADGSKSKTDDKTKKTDTIDSAKKENTESLGSFFYRIVCCPFTSIASVVRKLACFFTLGYCCNDKADPKDIAIAAKDAAEKYKKADKKEEKDAAFDAFFKAHDVQAELRQSFIDKSLEASFGDKLKDTKEDAKKPVIEQKGKEFDEMFDKKNSAVLEQAQKLFESKADKKN